MTPFSHIQSIHPMKTHTGSSSVAPAAPTVGRRFATLLALVALTLGLAAPPARAATANPPGQMSYQGFLTDANGNPLGSPSPTNTTVIFRIYDASSAGAKKWSEQQVVTIDKGYFTVLLGQGSQVGTETFSSDLTSVFTGADVSDRYLEMQVGGTSGTIIAPRIQFLPVSYAFLARNANALVSPNGASLVTTANGALTVNGTVTATTVTATTVTATSFSGSFSGSGANLTGLTAAQIPNLDAGKITTGTFADARIPSLAASKVTSGSFADAQIPSLNASKITAGTLPVSRGGTGSSSQNFVDLSNSQYSIGGNKSFANWIGIGTGSSNLLAPLVVAGISTRNLTGNYFDVNTGVNQLSTKNNTASYVSIKSEWFVEAFGFTAVSDQRIKDIVRGSESSTDLETIQKLQVTDYRMKDRVQSGDIIHKGLIAQEVQNLIPEAVQKGQNYIPNVYAAAKTVKFDNGSKTLSITLDKAHEMSAGDMARLIGDFGTRELPVCAVTDAKTFVVGPVETAVDRVFVYGKRVDDFLSVDYNRVFTTGIGAIQELAKKQGELTRQVEALRQSEARIAELELKASRVDVLEQKAGKVDALERKLAELEKLVARVTGPQLADRPAAVTPTTESGK